MAVASPEQASANQAVGTAYGDAGATADNQKAALLQAIAQAGQAGKNAFQAQQTQTQQNRTQALGSLAQQPPSQGGGGAFAQQLQQTVSQPGNVAEFVGAANNPASYYGGIGRASGDYMDAVKAAIPIQREWTQRQANSIAATAQQEREARQAQTARDNAAAARDAAANKQYQAIGPDGKPQFDAQGNPIMVSGSERASEAYTGSTTGRTAAQTQQQQSDRRALLAAQLGEGSQAMAAIDGIVNAPHVSDMSSANAALNKAVKDPNFPKTPGGHPLDLNAIRAYLRFIWDGTPVPTSASLAAANRAANPPLRRVPISHTDAQGIRQRAFSGGNALNSLFTRFIGR